MRSIISAGVLAALASTAILGNALAQAVSPAPAAAVSAAPAALAAPTPAALAAPPQPEPAAACPGNPDALGVSRVIAVDPRTSPFLGRLQYKQTLPLEKGEVVLTFDDGPLPPMTNRVLEALAHECVKATFFSVGRMANAYPHVIQKVLAEGHTIGTHSQTHPLIFPKLTQQAGVQEIEQGFASVKAALAPVGGAPNPWFRFPGLGRTKFYEAYTQEHGIAVFSVDAVADDWMHLKPEEVEKRALERLIANGGGILLLHDIQPSTAVMLPNLLRDLKANGLRIVHVVPAQPGMIASLPNAGPSGHKPAATAAAAPDASAGTAAAPSAVPPAKPVTATAKPAKPAVKPAVTSAPLPAVEQAQVGAPQQISPPAQADSNASSRGVTDPADTPFSLFWPRLWTDALPKGLR
ncbi:polysaccharide deacetylase family protein [Azorhizobium doebereinerae]|uniref:polysaccharide deacetylase family protein n=1 Tax=Azorhizobium doebereinerae TaxID=281091 RepID=UPI00041784F0|nr:polysaccharide deacetylase family protein [Azorhizobium doebereinerae]